MKNTLPLSVSSSHAVHPGWFRWLDRLLCVAVAFTIFQVTVGGLLHGGMVLSAHSEELNPSTPPNYTTDYGNTTHIDITDALFNEQLAPPAIAAYTAQTSQYSPAPSKSTAKVSTPSSKPASVATIPKTTPTKLASSFPATPKIAPIPAPVKKTVISPPVASVTHALSKPVPKEALKKPTPAPVAPIPVAAAAVVDESSLEIIADTGKKLIQKQDELAVVIPNKRVEDAITDHVKTIAQQQGYFTPATDTIKVEFPYLNPTPLTFFEAGLDPNAVKFSVSSGLSQFFTHQSMAKLFMVTPKGESRTVAIPFKVTLTRPVWVVGSTPIAPNQTLQPNQFKVEKRELTHDITSVVTAKQPLSNKAARLMLNPGVVLHQYQVMTPMMVKSYSQVHMVMRAPNGVHMLLEGKAMEDGRIGDRIRIQNKLNPTKIYTGVVIGDNRVSVKL